MPLDLKDFLRKMLAELEQQERDDLLMELKDKKLTSKELADAIRQLPENERAEVREAFISLAESQGSPSEKKQADKLEVDAEKEEEAAGTVVPGEKEEKTAKKVRHGRKHGRAYDWYVDEKGRVKVTDVAQVYSGEDEPDEVEMWEGEEENGEEEGIEEE